MYIFFFKYGELVVLVVLTTLNLNVKCFHFP